MQPMPAHALQPQAQPVQPPQNAAPKADASSQASVQAMMHADLPIVRHQLALAQSTLEPCFSSLSEAGDARGYHSLGPVTQEKETAVMEKLSSIGDALTNFARWSQQEGPSTGARYLQHCREVADKISRLQDNKQALSSSRRLLERHLPQSSRRKFLEQLEGIAREANVPFFALEEETKPTPPGEPTHCMSAQTFVLDFHVESSGKVAWAKLQRVLTSSEGMDEEAKEAQWQDLNTSLTLAMQSTDLEAALRDKFAALHRIEDAHSKHPHVQVYDSLRSLEKAGEALHLQHREAVLAAAAAAGGDKEAVSRSSLVGLGVMKRQVEGLQFEFYQSIGGWGGSWDCKALLRLLCVQVRIPFSLSIVLVQRMRRSQRHQCSARTTHLTRDASILQLRTSPGESSSGASAASAAGAAAADSSAGSRRVVMGLQLSHPVLVPVSTAAVLQCMDSGAGKEAFSSVRLLENESGAAAEVSWHKMALEILSSSSSAPQRAAASRVLRRRQLEVRGRCFDVVDDSSDVKGVDVHCVPVSTAAQMHEVLQILRQNLVMTEIFVSCFAAHDEEVEEASGNDDMDTENSAANVASGGGVRGGGKGDVAMEDAGGAGRQIIEIKAAPPSSIFVYAMAGGNDDGFALICLQVEVALGGGVSVM